MIQKLDTVLPHKKMVWNVQLAPLNSRQSTFRLKAGSAKAGDKKGYFSGLRRDFAVTNEQGGMEELFR